jgi:hypothetical protein
MKNLRSTYLFISLKRFVFFILLTILNVALTFLLIPVVADKDLTYRQAFYISLPIIILLAYFFSKIFASFYKETDKFNLVDLIKFVILLFDFLLLLFNIYIWIALLSYE